jgi:hypothetical protein
VGLAGADDLGRSKNAGEHDAIPSLGPGLDCIEDPDDPDLLPRPGDVDVERSDQGMGCKRLDLLRDDGEEALTEGRLGPELDVSNDMLVDSSLRSSSSGTSAKTRLFRMSDASIRARSSLVTVPPLL